MALNLIVLAISLWMLALVALWFAHPRWRVWIEQPKHRILSASAPDETPEARR
jgi:hypothetical protein